MALKGDMMKYFSLKADLTAITNKPTLSQEMKREGALLDIGTLKYDSNKILADYMETPIPLVSDALKNVLKMYDSKLKTTPLYFNDIKQGKQYLYWKVDVSVANRCIAETVTKRQNGLIADLVIDEKMAKHLNVFSVKDNQKTIWVVNQIVAESLLRRGLSGFELKEIKTWKGGVEDGRL